MKTVLVLYQSRSGHTARIARRIWETVIAEGNQADLMDVVEADREGLDWNKYDLVIAGASLLAAAAVVTGFSLARRKREDRRED